MVTTKRAKTTHDFFKIVSMAIIISKNKTNNKTYLYIPVTLFS